MTRAICALLLLLAACNGSGPSDGEPPVVEGVHLVEVASGLGGLAHLAAPAGDARLFVVNRAGRIHIIENGALLPTLFLDIQSKVLTGPERGLLSVAFHPSYAQNGFFYVNYTDLNGDTRVERYRVSTDRNRADPASASPVLSVAQPYPNHNGGMIAFGPDGMLYIGMGDGGSGGDPHGHGQDAATLLGDLLRVDVDAAQPYAVPANNPFVGQAGKRPEIWATGLRNPWRFSFDHATGLLYVADVGQNLWEEVNVVPAAQGGVNYGWNIMEAAHCYEPATGCNQAGLLLPVVEYSHAEGCSVTGGHVYRGTAIPSIRGHYFYADYCEGWIRSFRYQGGQAVDRREWALRDVGNVTSFGEDGGRELYLTTMDGHIYRFEPGP